MHTGSRIKKLPPFFLRKAPNPIWINTETCAPTPTHTQKQTGFHMPSPLSCVNLYSTQTITSQEGTEGAGSPAERKVLMELRGPAGGRYQSPDRSHRKLCHTTRPQCFLKKKKKKYISTHICCMQHSTPSVFIFSTQLPCVTKLSKTNKLSKK